MRLIFVRHGQTPSNVIGALDTAVPGPGLTELGYEQAEAVPAALAEYDIDLLYASVQKRAQLTAAPLASARGLEVLVREGLREIAAGELEMKSDWDSVLQYHETSFGWAAGDLERRMPGGENGYEALGRFDEVVAEAVESARDAAAFVAHGQIIRTWVAARARNVTTGFAEKTVLHNTGVVVVEGDPVTGWNALAWSGAAIGGPRVDEPTATTGPGGERMP
ncbi:histidine phosphatase family protein [Okibacterium endophyticum]